MKNSLKFLKFIPLLLLPVFFTSCIDFVETIGFKDGKYQINTKISFSKTLFEYAGVDADSLVNELSEEIIDDGMTIVPINGSSEIGVLITASIAPDTEDTKEAAFLPRVSDKTYFIPFLMGDSAPSMQDRMKGEDENTLKMVSMMLSTAKCRIFISKKVIPYAKSAFFDGTEKVSVDLFDFGDQYCLEVPFSLLATPSDSDFSLITVLGE